MIAMKKDIKSIVVFTDGASRGNPGHAAVGVVAYLVYSDNSKSVLFKISEYIGKQSNNYAEYTAVILALKELSKMNYKNTNILICTDSQLLVNQINGVWKVKNKNIKPLFDELQDVKKRFRDVKFQHINREYNKLADKLANEALDALKYSKPKKDQGL